MRTCKCPARILYLAKLIAQVEFSDPMIYRFRFVLDHGKIFLQAIYLDEDAYKPGVLENQYTRKWFISNEATDSQVIQTAFKCCLTSAEHRVREAFKYKGVRVYGPHYNVEDLVKLGRESQWKGAPKKDYRD